MAIDTYANLKTAIVAWLDNNELDDYIDDFIRIAEARHYREVRIREMLIRQPLIVNNRYVAVPSDFLEAKVIRLLTDTNRLKMTQLNVEALTDKSKVVDGLPKFFTVHAEIEFDRGPDQTYTGEIIFYTPLDPLDASNQSNELLDVAPDVYLYSCLAASAPLLHDDERFATWEALYVTARDDLNLLEKRKQQVGAAVATTSGTIV